MDMTALYTLLDTFQAVNGWRFRFVAGKWWVWDVDEAHWRTYDARVILAKALLGSATLIWDEGHSNMRKISKDYMITRLCAALVPRLRADVLEGSPQPGTWRPVSE